MKLIVGLGNPGRKYEQTRHNIGFVTVAKVASLTSASPYKSRFEGDFCDAHVAGSKVGLLCPQTYMNLSGQSVRKAVDFFKVEPTDVLVICDDVDLPVGRIRIKRSGSAGGQRGLADIIRHLSTDEFPRLKIGIGRPPTGWDTADYVLGKFQPDEHSALESVTTSAAKAAIAWVNDGVAEVMSQYNHLGKPPKPPRKPNELRKPKPPNPTPEAQPKQPPAKNPEP